MRMRGVGMRTDPIGWRQRWDTCIVRSPASRPFLSPLSRKAGRGEKWVNPSRHARPNPAQCPLHRPHAKGISMRRPHIAVLDEELPYPLTSGKRIRTYNLLRHLAGRYRVTYLARRNADPAEADAAARHFADLGITPITAAPPVPAKSGPAFY